MAVIHERIQRGIAGFPLGFYNQIRNREGICISPLHYHNDLEFILPLTGTARLLLNGETHLIQPGMLCAYHAGQTHALYADSTTTHFLCLVLPQELLQLSGDNAVQLQLIGPLYQGHLQLPLSTQDPEILSLAEQIFRLCGEIDKNKSLLTALLFHLISLYEHKGLIEPGKAPADLPIHAAITYMQQHLSERIDLQSISDAAGMSAKYFCTYFKKQAGATPITYLTSLRIRRACTLLKNRELSVLQIAADCGFDNVSFFIKKFKSATGQTPGQYRKAKEHR